MDIDAATRAEHERWLQELTRLRKWITALQFLMVGGFGAPSPLQTQPHPSDKDKVTGSLFGRNYGISRAHRIREQGEE